MVGSCFESMTRCQGSCGDGRLRFGFHVEGRNVVEAKDPHLKILSGCFPLM